MNGKIPTMAGRRITDKQKALVARLYEELGHDTCRRISGRLFLTAGGIPLNFFARDRASGPMDYEHMRARDASRLIDALLTESKRSRAGRRGRPRPGVRRYPPS